MMWYCLISQKDSKLGDDLLALGLGPDRDTQTRLAAVLVPAKADNDLLVLSHTKPSAPTPRSSLKEERTLTVAIVVYTRFAFRLSGLPPLPICATRKFASPAPRIAITSGSSSSAFLSTSRFAFKVAILARKSSIPAGESARRARAAVGVETL